MAFIKLLLPSKINSFRLNCCFLSDHTKVWVSSCSTHSYPTGACWVSAHVLTWLNLQHDCPIRHLQFLVYTKGHLMTSFHFIVHLSVRLSLSLQFLSFWRTLMSTIYCHSLSNSSECQGLGIIKPVWTEVQVLCKSKECSVPTNMESTTGVTLVMFRVKGTVGGCHIRILPSLLSVSQTRQCRTQSHVFRGLWKKTRETAVTNKPPPHPQHILSLPSYVSRPCLLSHLYCTCGKFILYRSTAVSGDIYEKSPSFENNTSLPTAEQGSLAQAPPESRGSKFISVCRGGAKSFFVLTGS